MKCPECGATELQVTNRDISYSYLGTSVTIPDIPVISVPPAQR